MSDPTKKAEFETLEAHDAIVAVCVAVPELPFRTAGAIVSALHQTGVFLVRAVGTAPVQVVGFENDNDPTLFN